MMKTPFHLAALTLAVAATLVATARPVHAQVFDYSRPGDYNSPAARALRQEIMNRAIIKQSTHGRRSRASRHKGHYHKKSSHSKHRHS